MKRNFKTRKNLSTLHTAATEAGLVDLKNRCVVLNDSDTQFIWVTFSCPYLKVPSLPINFSLSKGVSKKIHIARALAHNPTIFLFDDPFIFLDNNGKEMLIKLLAV